MNAAIGTATEQAAEPAVEAIGAGRRYGKFWALRDCTLTLPAGSITAVVGPNGAGKTTLLNMLVGLLPASAGQLRVVGDQPSSKPEFLAKVGFLAQDCPLYKEFSVSDLLRFGSVMNPDWDDALARERLAAAEVPLKRRGAQLSGGQRAQVALALAIAKRPQVLLLDEPLAALDPLARREFLRTLLDSVSATGITVVLSSHLIGELARVCDHLVVIRDGQLRLNGELDQLLAEHQWVAGAPEHTTRLPADVEVLTESHHERHDRLLVRTRRPLLNPALTVSPVDLEELVLAYLERPSRTAELAGSKAGSLR
ncbi:MAG TPA: ABC transporter ATP-binding protein [Jatrophihabitans sp.]|jgi:ABC-2 type transport system ATP-binding protein